MEALLIQKAKLKNYSLRFQPPVEVVQKEKIMWDKHSCLSFFAHIGQARMPIPPISVLLRQPQILWEGRDAPASAICREEIDRGFKRDFDLIIISTAHNVYKEIDFLSLNIPVVDTRSLLTIQTPLFFKA